MSPIRKVLSLTVLLAALAVLAGCGDSNPQTTFSSDSGKHSVHGWGTGSHAAAARTDSAACTECHGSDLGGGISKVSCTSCHLGDEKNVHPLDWGNLGYLKHAQYVTQNGIASCRNAACHGESLSGVASSGPSCTLCHLGGVVQVHPYPISEWSTPGNPNFHGTYLASHVTASCATAVCHGIDLNGVPGSGLSCQQCHVLNLP